MSGQTQQLSPTELNINDVLIAHYKVLNIEEAVLPVGPRDILLSSKRTAWAGKKW